MSTTAYRELRNNGIEENSTPVVDQDTRTIIVYGAIDNKLARAISYALPYMDDSHRPITVKINSQGGYVSSAMAICSELKKFPCPIIVDVVGECWSAATCLLLLGDNTIASRNASIMFHKPNYELYDRVEAQERCLENVKENWDRFLKELYELKPRKLKFKEFMNSMHDIDWYLTPKKALSLKLIDGIY